MNTKLFFLRIIKTFFLACFFLSMYATSASATLTICNRTCDMMYYAHTYYDSSCDDGGYCEDPYRNVGWYVIAPGACAVTYGGSVKNKTFWYFAENGSHLWTDPAYTWWVDPWPHDRCKKIPDCEYKSPVANIKGHRKQKFTTTNHTINMYNG